jgi:hypothetical protein
MPPIDIRRNYKNTEDAPSPEERQAKLDELMKQFLKKGGKVEKVIPGMAQGYGGLDRFPHYTEAEIQKKWREENNIPDPDKNKKGKKKTKK